MQLGMAIGLAIILIFCVGIGAKIAPVIGVIFFGVMGGVYTLIYLLIVNFIIMA